MVKWRVGRPPIPPDHPRPSEKSRKRSTKPRSQRGFAFWRNLRVPQPARFLTRQFWHPRRGASDAASNAAPEVPPQKGNSSDFAEKETRGAVRDLSPRL